MNNKKETQQPSQTEQTDIQELCIETPWSLTVPSPPWMNDFSVINLYSSSDSHLLWLESNNTNEPCDNHGVLCCWVKWKNQYVINV